MKKIFFLSIISVLISFTSCVKMEPLEETDLSWKGIWQNDTEYLELSHNGWAWWFTNDKDNMTGKWKEEGTRIYHMEGSYEITSNELILKEQRYITWGYHINSNASSGIVPAGAAKKTFIIDKEPTEEIDDNGLPYIYIVIDGMELRKTK